MTTSGKVQGIIAYHRVKMTERVSGMPQKMTVW